MIEEIKAPDKHQAWTSLIFLQENKFRLSMDFKNKSL